jgi:hypothetical protein
MNTELHINGTIADIDKSEAIALTRSVFDLNNLSVRTGSYSNTFKLPKTNVNRLIFKSSENINSSSPEPYTLSTATIKVDGVEVVNGSFEITESEKDYSALIKSGNSQFNQLLKDVTLSTLSTDLSTLNHPYTALDVNNRRDSSEGIVYPNVDYGWLERATNGVDQPFNYFYPALYLKFVFDAAFARLGYRKIGTFWDGDLYNRLAIMAKDAISVNGIFFVNYGVSNSFFVNRSTIQPSTYTIQKATALNFINEIEDPDSLYEVTDIGTAYTVLGYNFPSNFSAGTVFEINLNGTVTINSSIISAYRTLKIVLAQLIFRLEIWNKDTNTFVGYASEVAYDFYTASYGGGGGSVFFNSDTLISPFDINEAINDPSGLAAIGATAEDHALIWTMAVQTTQTSLVAPPSVTHDPWNEITVDLEFSLNQDSAADIPDLNIVDSFDDINVGSAFIYLCNVAGVFYEVDETLKTIRMVEFDAIKRNKAKAIDWSKKIDLSRDPKVTFKLDYAQRNIFKYNNDTKDVFLNALPTYGEGYIYCDNTNLQEELIKYQSPFSLCAIGATMSSGRSMAKIFTGEKYTFTGSIHVVDNDAKVNSFTTRVVLLSRVTSGLIQIDGESAVTGNYEVNNAPLLFDYAIRQKYSLVNDALFRVKKVVCLMRLNEVDFQQFDSSKPVFIDYFNDTFMVNSIDQFKVNKKESTLVTLIRI